MVEEVSQPGGNGTTASFPEVWASWWEDEEHATIDRMGGRSAN